ncbi:MAG: ABC transporter permease [Actinomycetes bacterium]
MAKFLAKRLVALVGILFVVSIGTFLLIHLLPGDPTVTILGPSDNAHNRAVLMQQLGLDKPIFEQYGIWIVNVLQGNLGQSFVTHQTVMSTLRHSVPIDLELVVISQVIALGAAIPLAIASAKRPNGLLDKITTTTSFAMLALPPFIIIVVMVMFFAIDIHVFPGPGSYVPLMEDPVSNLHTMILPSLVLAAGSVVVYFRLLRGDLISTLQEEFIVMARSKGLSDRYIMWRHALRPSSLSLLAAAGLNIGGLVAGAFVVEYLLQLPGLGYALVNSIQQVDYLSVQGITLFVAVVVVCLNFVIDFLFTIVDPRIARD